MFGVSSSTDVLIRTADYGAFTRAPPRIARATAVSLYELAPTDDLARERFSYLVRR